MPMIGSFVRLKRPDLAIYRQLYCGCVPYEDALRRSRPVLKYVLLYSGSVRQESRSFTIRLVIRVDYRASERNLMNGMITRMERTTWPVIERQHRRVQTLERKT